MTTDRARPDPALLGDVERFLRDYVVLTAEQAAVVTLWVAHTHAIEIAETTPYLNISSAAPASGKTRLLEALETIVANPWLTGRVSPAALIRRIDAQRPTLLLDETDAVFGLSSDYGETLRGILNTGYRRNGVASLCVRQGQDFVVRDLSSFGPKAFAGLGRLPDTVRSRSLPVRLQRRRRDERVKRFRERDVRVVAEPLRRRLEEWSNLATGELADARPNLPDHLSDRTQDAVEPLVAIADWFGDVWSVRARAALVSLIAATETDDEPRDIRLLAAIRNAFQQVRIDPLSSQELRDYLAGEAASEWTGRGPTEALTPVSLAAALRPFGIRPKMVRRGSETFRGYRRDAFDDAWARYLPAGDALPETAQQDAVLASSARESARNLGLDVSVVATEKSRGPVPTVADVSAEAARRTGREGRS